LVIRIDAEVIFVTFSTITVKRGRNEITPPTSSIIHILVVSKARYKEQGYKYRWGTEYDIRPFSKIYFVPRIKDDEQIYD